MPSIFGRNVSVNRAIFIKRRKKEEGRGKREEGRRKKEEGRRL